MRKTYTLFAFFLAFVTAGYSQVMYDNFERDRTVHYDFVHGTLTDYFINPDMLVNTSSHVGQYVRNAAEMFDVLVILPPGPVDDVSDYLSGTKTITVDVWSPLAGITVQVTLEDSSTAGPTNYPVGRHSIYLGTTSVANAWETVTLTYDSQPDASVPNTNVTSMILLFNPGTNTNDTYYFDNLMGPEYADPCPATAADPLIEFEGFDCNRNMIYEFTSGWNQKVVNPVSDAINSSAYCGYLTTNPDVDGVDVIVAEFAGTLDFSINNQAKMKVRAMSGGTVRVSMQADTVEQAVVDATFAGTGDWEEVTFDFVDLTTNTSVDHAVLLFYPGVVTNDSVWWDDFKLDGFIYVGVDDELNANFSLEQNFPNPFNGTTEINFSLKTAGEVSLTVNDLQGRTIANLLNDSKLPSGEHHASFDSEMLSPGIYFYTLSMNGVQQTKKLIVN